MNIECLLCVHVSAENGVAEGSTPNFFSRHMTLASEPFFKKIIEIREFKFVITKVSDTPVPTNEVSPKNKPELYVRADLVDTTKSAQAFNYFSDPNNNWHQVGSTRFG